METTRTTLVTMELNCACCEAERGMIPYAPGVLINNYAADNRTPRSPMVEIADQASDREAQNEHPLQ